MEKRTLYEILAFLIIAIVVVALSKSTTHEIKKYTYEGLTLDNEVIKLEDVFMKNMVGRTEDGRYIKLKEYKILHNGKVLFSNNESEE